MKAVGKFAKKVVRKVPAANAAVGSTAMVRRIIAQESKAQEEALVLEDKETPKNSNELLAELIFLMKKPWSQMSDED